jgi:polysaccharide export outer membrane protein
MKAGEGDRSSYRLGPEDLIEMTVYREDDLAIKTKLDRDGTVVLPLIGEVRLGGLTLKQARKLITDLYERDYLVSPQVNLTYTSKDAGSSGTFTVLGSVSQSGVFPLPKGRDRITIREAIAMAGGVTRYASETKIKVRRRVGNEDKIFEINLKRMNDDADTESFYILAGDSINVPERIF